MNKLLLVSTICLSSVVQSLDFNTEEKFLGLPLKTYAQFDPVEESDDLYSQKTYPCTFKLGNGIYDFTPFKIATNSTPIPAYWQTVNINMTDPQNPQVTVDVYNWNFTWCQFMSAANNATCNGDYFAAGSDFKVVPSQCVPFSGSSYKSINAQLISGTNINYQTNAGEDITSNMTGVSITYAGGAACPTGGSTSFTINVYCNSSMSFTDYAYNPNATGSGTICNPVVQVVSSIGGCDILQNSIIWEYLNMIKPYVGVIAIVGGFILCFFGLQMIKPSVCIVTFLTVLVAVLFIFYAAFLDALTLTPVFWYFLGGGVIGGIVVGILMAKFVKFGAAMLGGWGGFAVGLILNECLLYRFELSWLFWTSNIICIVVAAVVTFKVFEPAIIASTALIGSYFIARGVSCYLGHYYNEFTIINELKAGAYTTIDPLYWAYVGGFVLFTIIGILYQRSRMPKKVDAHPYHR